MSDGTTAVQVSPIPTEDDMNKVRAIFEQGLNSIIGLAQISKDVEALRGEITSLKGDLEYLRQKNKDLDEMLVHVRTQRDEAERKLSEANRKVEDTQAELRHSQELVSNQAQEIERLKTELGHTRQDRDAIETEAIHNLDRAEKAEHSLAEFKSKAMDIFGLIQPEPKPVEAPQASGQGQPLSEAQAQTVQANPEKPWVYEDQTGFDWGRPSEWDMTSGKHRQRAA